MDNMTIVAVAIPPNGVRTPLASLIAVRVNDPVTGIERTNDPNKLQHPIAIISCVASTVFPLAKIKLLFIHFFYLFILLTKCFRNGNNFQNCNHRNG